MAKEDAKPDDKVAVAVPPPAVAPSGPVGTPATEGHEVIEMTPSGPQIKATQVNTRKLPSSTRPLDETIPGGMIVARVNNGRDFEVQDANGNPIHGKKFDVEKQEIVNA